jgi:hypothetical protein
MVHGIIVPSSNVLAKLLLALESDVGDLLWIDNAFKPKKSLYHVKYARFFFFFEGGRKSSTNV